MNPNNSIAKSDLKNIKFIRQIGSGSYGKVFHVKKGDHDLAWKVMINDGGTAIDSITELDIMNRLRHPYLMPALRTFTTDLVLSNPESLATPASDRTLKDWTYDSECETKIIPSKTIPAVVLEMPFAVEQIEKFILKFKPPSQSRVRWMYEIATAMNFLHENNILHLDLKIDNIMISKTKSWVLEGNTTNTEYRNHAYSVPDSFMNFKAVLIDFSLSVICTQNVMDEKEIPLRKSRRLRITPNYCPLEIHTQGEISSKVPEATIDYTSKSDTWSYGMLLLKVFSDVDPVLYNYFSDKPNGDIKEYILKMIKMNFETITSLRSFVDSHVHSKNLKDISELHLSQLKELIINCLHPDISNRLSSSQIINSKLFENLLKITEDTKAKGFILTPELKGIKMIRTAHYAGMGYLIKLCNNWKVGLETFFLGADIYQRLLYYSPKVTNNQIVDLDNFTLWGACCFWVAHSVLEEYCGNPLTLDNIHVALGGKFDKKRIISTERLIINSLGGLIYFKQQCSIDSLSNKELITRFEAARDLFNYRSFRNSLIFNTQSPDKNKQSPKPSKSPIKNTDIQVVVESPHPILESQPITQIGPIRFDEFLKQTEYSKLSTKKWNDFKEILNQDNRLYLSKQ